MVACPALPAIARAPLQGVRQVLRWNRRQYFAAALAVAVAALVPYPFRLLGLPALFWTLSSLSVSWLVYDRSPLFRLGWLDACLPEPPRTWIHLHAGLDETSHLLAARFPHSRARVLDIFDPREMTEPSIRSARSDQPVLPSQPASWRALPLPAASTDAAFLIFTAHELRRPASRVALFREIARVLRPGGTLIIVEHLRDAANFLAYGPGFLHFLPARAYHNAADAAGLRICRRTRITPFVNVFVLRSAR